MEFFLNEVFCQIDASSINNEQILHGEGLSLSERLNNWDFLLKNIYNFYVNKLQQYIIDFPNLIILCRQTSSDAARIELHKTLQLMITAACNCDQREDFVRDIQQIFLDPMDALVIKEAIQETMEDICTLTATNTACQDVPSTSVRCQCHTLRMHVFSLLAQRSTLLEMAKEMLLELEVAMASSAVATSETLKLVDVNGAAGGNHLLNEERHWSIELNRVKADNRKLRTELDDRHFEVDELRDQVNEQLSALKKLNAEMLSLKQEARCARILRDELDIAREKASQFDRLEAEVERGRDRQNQLEWARNRLQTLEEDLAVSRQRNDILEAQRGKLEAQLERVRDLEKELVMIKQRNEDIVEQHEEERKRLAEVLAENGRLQTEQLDVHANIRFQLDSSRARLEGSAKCGVSLDEQLSEASRSELLRLQLDKQELLNKLQELKDLQVNATRLVEVEKENRRLSVKMEKLTCDAAQEMRKSFSLESQLKACEQEKEQLLLTLEMVKEKTERHLAELTKENEQQADTIQSLREGSVKSMDERVCNLAHENNRLHRLSHELTMSNSKMQLELKQLQRVQERAKEQLTRTHALEANNDQLTREAADLRDQLDCLKLANAQCNDLEQSVAQLRQENDRLVKTLDSHKKSLAQKNLVEQDNDGLRREKERLARLCEHSKQASLQLVVLETEKEDLTKRVDDLERGAKQLHAELDRKESANSTLQGQLHLAQSHVVELEEERAELTRQTEHLRGQVEHLEQVEKENGRLTLAQQTLQQERTQLERDVRRLRAEVDAKQHNLSEALDENGALRQSLVTANSRSDDALLSQAKQEAYELRRELDAERKATAVLCEQMVLEKMQSEKLSHELDRLHAQLGKMDNSSLPPTNEPSIDQNMQHLQRKNFELLQRNAQLQVEHAAMHAQNDASRSSLKALLLESKAQASKAQANLRQLTYFHDSLNKDHEALQALHEELSAEYERLLHELHRSKDAERQLRSDAKTHLDQLCALRACAAATLDSNGTTQVAAEKTTRWRREREEWLALKDKLEQDLRMLTNEYKSLKREYNDLHLKYTHQSGDLVECRDQLNSMDVEVAKMANRCMSFHLANNKLERDLQAALQSKSSVDNSDYCTMQECRQLRPYDLDGNLKCDVSQRNRSSHKLNAMSETNSLASSNNYELSSTDCGISSGYDGSSHLHYGQRSQSLHSLTSGRSAGSSSLGNEGNATPSAHKPLRALKERKGSLTAFSTHSRSSLSRSASSASSTNHGVSAVQRPQRSTSLHHRYRAVANTSGLPATRSTEDVSRSEYAGCGGTHREGWTSQNATNYFSPSLVMSTHALLLSTPTNFTDTSNNNISSKSVEMDFSNPVPSLRLGNKSSSSRQGAVRQGARPPEPSNIYDVPLEFPSSNGLRQQLLEQHNITTPPMEQTWILAEDHLAPARGGTPLRRRLPVQPSLQASCAGIRLQQMPSISRSRSVPPDHMLPISGAPALPQRSTHLPITEHCELRFHDDRSSLKASIVPASQFCNDMPDSNSSISHQSRAASLGPVSSNLLYHGSTVVRTTTALTRSVTPGPVTSQSVRSSSSSNSNPQLSPPLLPPRSITPALVVATTNNVSQRDKDRQLWLEYGRL